MSKLTNDQSLSEVHSSVDTTKKAVGIKRLLSFIGPAYLVSVGYMDPGNWATDLAGGAKFGYQLIWVLLMSNIMAQVLQALCARLGIVHGRDLAQANREAFPKHINFILYIFAEVAIAATDLAEVLGMAIGIQLLTGLPLIWGVSITVLDTFLLLFLQRLGIRKMEAFIIGLVAIVALSFLFEIIIAKPQLTDIAKGFIPTTPNKEALFIAIGIIGATVMPHNLYLHSALVQTRKIEKTAQGIKQALKYNLIDSTIALNIAFLVNAAILILAATAFYKTGNSNVAAIHDAHKLLQPLLGNKLAPILFAVALIAAGQSSTITGTLAGQIVMEGYLSLRISPTLRRLITRLLAIVPALIVIALFGEQKIDDLLIFSQVVLSLQLGFAVIPLIHFVSNKQKMGAFVIKPYLQIIAWLIATILVYLNLKMLWGEFYPILLTGSLTAKITIIIFIITFVLLLLYVTLQPLLSKQLLANSIKMHANASHTLQLTTPTFSNIAIALDFSADDEKIISHALAQGNSISTKFHIIHIVESATAKFVGKEMLDYESQQDKLVLDQYIQQLNNLGYQAEGHLGFKSRAKTIAKIITTVQADLLVIGAHGHSGLTDFIYGETVNSVRHQINIPVFVVKV
jgi:manganese transport protein